jgi:thiamine transporter
MAVPESQVEHAAGSTKSSPQGSVKILAEVAIMVSLATVLNSVKIFTFPEGGSITLGAMVPILYIALRRGVKVGVLSGAVFGLIDLYFEYFVYNPIQFLLDYPLAFASLGLAGLLAGRTERLEAGGRKRSAAASSVIGVAVGISGRFVCHFLSGLIFFGSYAPPGESPAVYSAVYNASYLIPELFISAFAIFVLTHRGALRIGK